MVIRELLGLPPVVISELSFGDMGEAKRPPTPNAAAPDFESLKGPHLDVELEKLLETALDVQETSRVPAEIAANWCVVAIHGLEQAFWKPSDDRVAHPLRRTLVALGSVRDYMTFIDPILEIGRPREVDDEMESVVSVMRVEKFLSIASILGLHSPNTLRPTLTHVAAALEANKRMLFSEISEAEMKREIQYEISTAGGHTIGNLLCGGKGVSYRDVVWIVARKLKLEPSPFASISEVEGLISQSALKSMLVQLTPEQQAELLQNLERLAAEHGRSFRTEGGALAALTVAQLSGFGIFLAASTVIGAITGILGIVLPFAFYTAMTWTLGVLIGPLGWTALGVVATAKLGAPNIKKLLPAVLFIAMERNAPR